ncbi:BRI1 kinase inhibitor 1 [Linum perenne]
MDTQLRGKVVKQETRKEDLSAAAAAAQQVPASSSSSAVSPASPPSATTSPSHEFSFTISLHSSSAAPPLPDTSSNANNKSKPITPNSSSSAIDLSPADDIFFHGHLLPLHLLSHLPTTTVSPRSSTNSMDSFTLPIRELVEDQVPSSRPSTISQKSNSTNNIRTRPISNQDEEGIDREPKLRAKSKSFSLFGWRKRCEAREREDKEKQKKRPKFDVSHMVKRYARMVKPLLSFRGKKENNPHFQRQQPYSFSGHLSVRNSKHELRGRKGEFSAPASMRTSPSNSGLLCTIPSPSSDSTMEELQAAIQAAIAHCKNSIAAEEKIKC